jgi:hypothetical protein
MRLRRLLVLALPTTAALAVVTALTGAPSAAALTGATPTFVTSQAPAYDGSTFFQSDSAGEPSIGVNWKTGRGMFMAGTDTYQLSFDSATGAVTWQDRSSPFSVVNLDPILATDSQTGLTLAGGDDGPCAVMSATKTDGGSTPFSSSDWTPTAPCPFTADHPTVGIGPAPAGGLSVGGRVAYFCQQSDVDHCSHSIDGGQTWAPSVPTTACAGLHGHIKISADGTAYLPSVNCVDASGNLVVGAMTSTNGGLTWGGYGIAGATEPARGFDPSVATTSDNTVFETWSRAGDYHPVVAVSRNHGSSWSTPVDLAQTVSGLQAATFESAVGGDGGRAAVAFLGSTVATPSGVTPFDSGYNGLWNLYVSYTDDYGVTWTTVQVTNDPVQRGFINDGGVSANDQRNLLDFMDAAATRDGRVVVAYADGCISAACTGASGTPADSIDAKASVAYQTGGELLFTAPRPTL